MGHSKNKKMTYSLSGVDFEDESYNYSQKSLLRSDSLIENDLRRILLEEKNISPEEIKFIIQDGVIRLEGTVSSFSLRRILHERIKKIEGVIEILDHLQISS